MSEVYRCIGIMAVLFGEVALMAWLIPVTREPVPMWQGYMLWCWAGWLIMAWLVFTMPGADE